MISFNKRVISVIVISAVLIMLILSVLFFSATVNAACLPNHIRRNNDGKELKLVHVVLRHGDRTPADTYITDPHINETFYPYGWGQLTNVGKRSVYETGNWLRQRYGQFLGEVFTRNILHSQSTGVTRTQESMQLLLAGLFPPKNSILAWNKNLNWQPIAYQSEPLDQDSLLLVRIPCARYHEELNRVFAETEIRNVLEENLELFEQLSNFSGLSIKTPEDVQSLYSTLKAEKEFGLQLPQWTQQYFPTRLQNLTDLSFTYNVYNDELKKLKGGPFVKKMLQEWTDYQANQLKPVERKIFLYIGHDSTVVNILSAFKVWETQFPDYTTMAIFELLKDRETNAYGVEIFLKKSPHSDDLIPLIIPGCNHFCPLEKLSKLLKSVIPNDLKKECEAQNQSFSTPPPRGP